MPTYVRIQNKWVNVGSSSAQSDGTFFGPVTVTNRPYFRNGSSIPTASTYVITSAYNEMSVGPITIPSGSSVEVSAGSVWTIV